MAIWEAIAAPILKIIDKVIPDPAAKDAAKLELLRLQQSGELATMQAEVTLAVAQTDINKAEATNPSTFVSGWRPFVGWVCGSALAYQFLMRPIVGAILVACNVTISFPSLDMGTLMTLLGGMLGFGAMRTVEKLNGVAGK